ncbi:MAG: hypothetical protein PHQ04_07170 [Opitutaceae bacterium]|nr:hypothetical protein [Opitutaceae bacterium]
MPRLELLAARLRAAMLRCRSITVGHGCHVGPRAMVRRTWGHGSYGSIALGDRCDLRDSVIIESWGGDVRLGHNVFVGFALLLGFRVIATAFPVWSWPFFFFASLTLSFVCAAGSWFLVERRFLRTRPAPRSPAPITQSPASTVCQEASLP